MFEKLRVVFAVAKAARLAAHQNYESAIAELERLFSRYGVKVPTENTPLVANILYAQTSHQIGRNAEAFYACKASLVQIGSANPQKRRRTADLQYLRFRIKWILSNLSTFKDSEAVRMACAVNINYTDIDLIRVSLTIKAYFPMTAAQAAQVEGYLLENC